MTDATVAALGKLTIHGDFVRIQHAQVPEIVEFDRWLLDGMERAYAARGRGFEAELRTLPPLRFLYLSPTSGRLLDGVVLPSQDQVGRAYPFVAGFALPCPAPGPGYDRLPLQAPAHLQALVDLVADAASSTLPQFTEKLQALPFALDDNAAEQALRGFLFGTSLDALWADWPGFHAPERRQQCLHELWQMSQPPFPPRYLTVLPMRAGAGEASFWLTLLRQWLPVRANPRLLCWPLHGGGAIRLLFDELHGRWFEPLFWPGRGGNLTLDLGRQAAAHRPAPGVPSTVLAASLRPRALLQDVILAAARG